MSTKKHKTKRLPKYRKMNITLSTKDLTLYAGQKVLTALEEVTTDMTLYKGVRLGEVMTAVYEQGLKDGRKEVIEHFEAIKGQIKYLPPGRPRK